MMRELRVKPGAVFAFTEDPNAEPVLYEENFDVIEIHCGPPAPLPSVPTPEELLQQAALIDFRWEFWPE